MIFKNIKTTLKQIPKGTFSYKKYKAENRNMKTITSYDHIFEYSAQLPYVKVVTYPVAIGIYTGALFAFAGGVYLITAINNRK